jgi:hypothetical protein
VGPLSLVVSGRRTSVATPGGGDEGVRIVLTHHGQEVATWTLQRPGPPDLQTVEELARLHLVAKRLDSEIRVHAPSRELVELIGLAGLAGVLEVALPEPGGETEPGEEPRVEEVVVPDNPVP